MLIATRYPLALWMALTLNLESGAVKAKADFPICTTLHTVDTTTRLRFACVAGDTHQSIMTEYDESLHMVSQLALGKENAGLPIATEQANGQLALLGSHGHYQSDIQLYSATGKPLDRYIFPQQGSVAYPMAVGPSEIAVLRDTIANDGNSKTLISWLRIQ